MPNHQNLKLLFQSWRPSTETKRTLDDPYHQWEWIISDKSNLGCAFEEAAPKNRDFYRKDLTIRLNQRNSVNFLCWERDSNALHNKHYPASFLQVGMVPVQALDNCHEFEQSIPALHLHKAVHISGKRKDTLAVWNRGRARTHICQRTAQCFFPTAGPNYKNML